MWRKNGKYDAARGETEHRYVTVVFFPVHGFVFATGCNRLYNENGF
jgi:hypothetical protein